jgi:hypothetical protein
MALIISSKILAKLAAKKPPRYARRGHAMLRQSDRELSFGHKRKPCIRSANAVVYCRDVLRAETQGSVHFKRQGHFFAIGF